MEDQEGEEIEGTYIDLDKLEEDSERALEFINEELGVEELDNYLILLDNMEQMLKRYHERSKRQPEKPEKVDLDQPSYIG